MKRLFYFMLTILLMAGFSGCMEEIEKTPVGGDEIYADNTELELLIGQKHLLTASPDNGSFTWTSSNPSVVTVVNGMVEAVGPGDAEIIINGGGSQTKIAVTVGSRIPKLATHFGNGLLVRWDTTNSNLLKYNELTYFDRDGLKKTAKIDGRLDTAFVADFGSKLEVASVYFRNDTIRIAPGAFLHKNAAAVLEFAGAQFDARNFDFGKDVGWHDNTPKNTLNNKYRDDMGENNCGVDIGADNNVGAAEAGEWLQYTLQVNVIGTYIIGINGIVPSDSTLLKFVLDNGTDTINYKIVSKGDINPTWMTAKAKEQPSIYMTTGVHTLKLLFTDGNIRLTNLSLRPKSSLGGSLLPALQYLFEFPDDYTKPSIGTKNLAFTEHNTSSIPHGDLAAKGVVPLSADNAPVNGYAITIPQPVTMRVTNPSYNEITDTYDTIKKYTMLWDVKIPVQGAYYALLHARDICTNGDAHFFINRSNCLGRGSYGTTPLMAERWYRVVLTVDVSGSVDSAKYKIYLDGNAELDNPWVASNTDRFNGMMLHRHFWVAADENSEDNQMDLAQFCFWADTCLNPTQVAALGKIRYPSAPPLGITKATRYGNGVVAHYEDTWRVNYYARYTSRAGDNYGYYSYQTSADMLYPYCYAGLRVQVVESSGRMGDPQFFPESQMKDISIDVSDTQETIIPAVNFDGGGIGVGYYDDSKDNQGSNHYRINFLHDVDSYVDIGGTLTADPDPFTDMEIGWTAANEWLQYTVYAKTAGKYYLDVYITANGSGAAYAIVLNGEELRKVDIINNGSWSAFRWYQEHNNRVCDRVITLRKGYNTIRYLFKGGSHNIKGLRLKPFTAASAPAPAGITTAVKFGNGLSLVFDDIDCVGSYTLKYTNIDNVQKTLVATTKTAFIAGYKSDLTVTHTSTKQEIPFDLSSAVDKTRTLATGGTVDIPAIDFDGGGRNIGYGSTITGGTESVYRATLGDFNCPIDVESNRNIRNMQYNEWLQYTINVETEGDYSVDLNIAVGKLDAVYALTVNGTKTQEYPLIRNSNYDDFGTYRWHSTVNACMPVVHLKSGLNVLRFNVESGLAYNLQTIRLGSTVHTPIGVTHATNFANGLSLRFRDNACIAYTLGYTNSAGAATTINVTAETKDPLFIADYKSDLTVKITSTGEDMAYDVSQIVDKTRTLATGDTLDIAAVDFDGGGSNIGYRSVGGNNFSAYRTELDDPGCTISVAGSGAAANRYINTMQNGDWMQYTIDAESEGDYSLDLNIAVNGVDAKYSIEINGVKTASYSLVNNGNWTAFWHSTKSACLPIVHLKQGRNALRFYVESSVLYDLKGLRLTPASATHEPLGISRAVKFSNALIVTFVDNLCVNYTLEYVNLSGAASTKNVTAADVTQKVIIYDYLSGLTAKVTATGAVIPFTNIEDVSSIVTAAEGLPEMWAVNVDFGGLNVGYYDQGNGGGNTYRLYLGDVDNNLSIEQSGTNPATLNLSHTNGDEWYQYTVFVETAGAYKFDYRVSTNGGACAYKLTVNGGTAAGGEETGVIELQNWGQWQSYRWYHEYYNATQPNPVVNLRAGNNTIRLSIPSGRGGYNIRSWRLLPQ